MKTRHKHAELIIAWANGAEIESRNSIGEWYPEPYPFWHDEIKYRVKQEDVVRYCWATEKMGGSEVCFTEANGPNLKLVFDAETGKLKGAELL